MIFTTERLEKNFENLCEMVGRLWPEGLDLLYFYKHDEEVECLNQPSVEYAGFLTAPAGSGMHHHRPGGLVVHLIEMIEIAHRLHESFFDTRLSLTKVVQVIVMHDLHKAHKTFAPKIDEAKDTYFEYATHVSNDQLTNNAKSLWMLAQVPASMGVMADMEVMNAFYSSEGGYAKNAPKEQSFLAKFCYICDELSVLECRYEEDRWLSTKARKTIYFL